MLHLIHVDHQFFCYTASRIFRCFPSASPAHENRNKGSILLCFNNFTKKCFRRASDSHDHLLIFNIAADVIWGLTIHDRFYIDLLLFVLFQHYSVYTLYSAHRLHSSVLNKVSNIIWPLMERVGGLLSSPSPASPSSTPSRSPSPSPSCVKGQASIFRIYRIPSHFTTYRAGTNYSINITSSALPIPYDSFPLPSS